MAKKKAYPTQAETAKPAFRQRYSIETNRPRVCPGAISHCRMGTVMDNMPMAIPWMERPIMSAARLGAKIWIQAETK